MSVYAELRRRLAEAIEERKLSPDTDGATIERLVSETVQTYQTAAHGGDGRPLRDPQQMARRLWYGIVGYGPITELLARPDVEEIFIEANSQLACTPTNQSSFSSARIRLRPHQQRPRGPARGRRAPTGSRRQDRRG